jgi:hypothetical protein
LTLESCRNQCRRSCTFCRCTASLRFGLVIQFWHDSN